MRVKVNGRHVELKEDLKTYATEKAAHLEHFYDRIQHVDVIFDQDGTDHRCELIATADHHTTFVAKESRPEAMASFDAAVKDIERQLTRHKEKFRNRKHLTGENEA